MNIIKTLKCYRYEILAASTGASVMILEITGARLLAPYFGMSTYVWTAMIGVILAALSFGFWYGGKTADKDDPKRDVGIFITFAAGGILLLSLFYKPVLDIIAQGNLDLRISATLAAIVLFSIPSALIGMVSPHLAKIQVTSLKTSGSAIGRLEAAGAIGSIAGTFLSGYFLFSYIGSHQIIVLLAIALVLVSFIADASRIVKSRVALLFIGAALLFAGPTYDNVLLDVDTAYDRYQVVEGVQGGNRVVSLRTDREGRQSAYYPDKPEELVFDYAKTFEAATLTDKTSPKDFLVIGGGSHILPSYIADNTESSVDVVEIDPALDDIAEEFFGYREQDQITIINEDGREYLNNNIKKYDAVLVDAFSSLTPPFQLSTVEFARLASKALASDGVVYVNAPSDFNDSLMSSLFVTYSAVFDYVGVVQANPNIPLSLKQNYLLIASDNSDEYKSALDTLADRSALNVVGGSVLTDDFAPVERLSY